MYLFNEKIFEYLRVSRKNRNYLVKLIINLINNKGNNVEKKLTKSSVTNTYIDLIIECNTGTIFFSMEKLGSFDLHITFQYKLNNKSDISFNDILLKALKEKEIIRKLKVNYLLENNSY